VGISVTKSPQSTARDFRRKEKKEKKGKKRKG
jgi:hypothetical protein